MIDMTRGGPAKLILVFTIPMFVGSVFQQLYNVTDSIIVGRFLGKEALAAVGASFPVMFLLVALTMGATMGITVLISQYYGAGNYEKVKVCIESAYVFLLLASVILTVTGLLLNDFVLNILNIPVDVYANTKMYLNIMFSGLILLFGYNAISAILRGLGDSKTPLYLLILASFLNIGLDLLFILVFGWGIRGAAAATVIAQGFSFIGGIVYLHRKNPLFRVNYMKLRFDSEIFVNSLKIGLPTGAQQMLVATGILALLRIVTRFGSDAIAAYTVAGRIDSFMMMPAMNLSMAMSTFVGQNIGAGKHDRVRAAIKTGLLMSSVIAVCISILVIVFRDSLIRLFTHDPAVLAIGRSYLVIVGGFYIAFMVMFIFNGALRGAGDTLIPMFITLLSLWLIRIPVSAYLSGILGTDGIWWGVPVAWIAGALLSALYFFSGRWKKKIFVKSSITPDKTAKPLIPQVNNTPPTP
jgi:putative MATE family efflux protein